MKASLARGYRGPSCQTTLDQKLRVIPNGFTGQTQFENLRLAENAL
jgi:hypothetical protein